MRRSAVLALLLFLGAGCTAPQAKPAGTQVIGIHLLGADQRPAPDWTINTDTSTRSVNCYSFSSPYASGSNIQTCGSYDDGAAVCWAPPGQDNLYCGTDPWTHNVRKLYSTQTLTAVPAPTYPEPWGLEVADGSRCTIRTNHSWSVNPDGTVPMYICRDSDPTPYVLALPEQEAADRSNPIWTVLVGDIEIDNVQPAAPSRVAVRAAYFAA